MIFENIVLVNIPVGLVNDRKPLGHSGHRKLQDVVGSIAMEKGTEGCITFPEIFEY